MWPKRKIQLVASSSAPGIAGVRAVLKGIQLEFSEEESTTEDLGNTYSECWMEKPFVAMTGERGPVTELVYWSEGSESDLWRKRALALGIKPQPIQTLIHNLLEDELVLWISEPTVLIEGRPMLGYILEMAGFEPTILWPMDGEWRCVRKQGLHWLLPESWLEGIIDKSTLGRRVAIDRKEQTTWVVRETQVDFYHSSGAQSYLGHLPRWPEPSEEPIACEIIAKCLDMGVSWHDIRLALSSLWKNIRMMDNMRWNINDSGWNAGTCGKTISAAPVEHLENWWSR